MFREATVQDFGQWRTVARDLLLEGVEPSLVNWNGECEGLPNLGLKLQLPNQPKPVATRLSVPSGFIERAEIVACHASRDTWGLLYRLLWRLALTGERGLLRRVNDPDVSEFALREKTVRRERHKMTAFVRFRKASTPDECPEDRETFIAWYELTHDVVRLAAPFFRDRFATMNWSILTPLTCVHWDGTRLLFSEGRREDARPAEDELETYWKTYYASIFNPARLNMRMMEQEMPRRYWKNLPEAEIISELANGSYGRTRQMEDHVEDNLQRRRRRPLGAPDGRDFASCQSADEIRMRSEGLALPALAELAQRCQVCGLCESATQTVWGEGPEDAGLMVVGEQPGDQEDITGRPFVGPAGQLLSQAMAQTCGDRSRIYLTNAVKHFKWSASGKHRLHKKPDSVEIAACNPWLQAELKAVNPTVVICLGATAGKSILGRPVSVSRERGLIDDPGRPFRVVLTWHPSFLLRIREKKVQDLAKKEFLADLDLANQLVLQSS